MAVSIVVSVYLFLLLKYVSTALILDCGSSSVSTVEGKTAQLRCTGINAAETVEWRHAIPGVTASEIIVSTCQDQNVCKDNSADRYQATRPTSNTSVLTIVSVSRDDTARWTCQAGVDQETCFMPAAIYPANVTENCKVTVKEDSVEVSCTIYKAYPSPTCTWSEYFYSADRLSLLNDTKEHTYMEPPKTYSENGNLYYNTSCRLFRNISNQVGTLNYTVVISPGAVVRSSIVAVASGSRSSTVPITPSSTTSSESTTPSTKKSEDITNEVVAAPAETSLAVPAFVPYGVIGIGVGAAFLVAIVTAVTCIIYKLQLKRTQRNESLNDGVWTTDSARSVNNEGVYEIPEIEIDSLPISAIVDGSDQYLTPVDVLPTGGIRCLNRTDGNSSTRPRTEDEELYNLPSPPPHCASENDNGYLIPVTLPLVMQPLYRK